MAWKNLIGPHAITSRRRVVASALMYGLSLTVRFTSATGEETENPAQAAQTTNPLLSIMIKDGAQVAPGRLVEAGGGRRVEQRPLPARPAGDRGAGAQGDATGHAVQPGRPPVIPRSPPCPLT